MRRAPPAPTKHRGDPATAAIVGIVCLAACDEAAVTIDCLGGTRLDVDGHVHCVYSRMRVETSGEAFRCPGPVPSRVRLDEGGVVCTDHDTVACELPEEVCRLLGTDCCPSEDAGPGADAGLDASPDVDAGPEAPDAAPQDAEPDDAGPRDAGRCEQTVTIDGPDATDETLIIGSTLSCAPGMMTAPHGSSSTFGPCYLPWSCFWLVRGLLRFDLGTLPEGASVTSATLRLYVDSECSVASGDPDNCGSFSETWELSLRPIARPWSEAEATWVDASAEAPWATPGVESSPDLLESPAHAITIEGGVEDVYVSGDVTESVRAFVDGSIANHGWLVTVPELARPRSRCIDGLPSSEHPNPALWPRLTVVLEAPCP